MAKWFKEFPINLKTGTDRTRTASESRGKLGMVASIGTKAVGSKGRTDRTGCSPKDAKVWDSLLPGKSRKMSKTDCVVTDEQHQQRPPKSSGSANAYISRLIRLDKQDKSPNFNSAAVTASPAVAPPRERETSVPVPVPVPVQSRTGKFSSRLLSSLYLHGINTFNTSIHSWC